MNLISIDSRHHHEFHDCIMILLNTQRRNGCKNYFGICCSDVITVAYQPETRNNAIMMLRFTVQCVFVCAGSTYFLVLSLEFAITVVL